MDIQKKLLTWTRVCASALLALIAVLIVSLCLLLPRLSALTQATELMESLSAVSGDLEQVSGQLKEIDWTEMAGNINDTAIKSQEGVQAALDAVDELDIATLNEAIADLGTVIQPLANIIEKLGG